jgi:hypothetical protein
VLFAGRYLATKVNTIWGIDSDHFGNTLAPAGCFGRRGRDSGSVNVSGNLVLDVTGIDGVHMMRDAQDKERGDNLHGWSNSGC